MSAILPPAATNWWKEPIGKQELIMIVLALLWSLFMFFFMIYWHINGRQNLSNEKYKTTAAMFSAKAEQMVKQYQVRTETDLQVPVVKPPAGSDVYLIARMWNWWPILELEAGKTYKLHVSSMDYLHGFSLQPVNINIEIVPGYEHVIKLTPDKPGIYSLVCNEFCGIGHHTMLGRIYVK